MNDNRIIVGVDALKFTEILENYWMLCTTSSESEAKLWLRDYLKSEAGLRAVEELVSQAVDQATDMIDSGETLEAYEAALKERKGKKNEELN